MPKCANCRDPFERPPGAGSFHNWCSAECGLILARKKQERAAAKKRAAVKRERTKARKAVRELNRQDRRWQHKKTQPVFNRMRVLEELLWFKEHGLEPECISCGKTKMDWCCGHFKTVGHSGILRYDRDNTFLQCNHACNMNLSGNIEGNSKSRGYREGLRQRFGRTEGQAILDYLEANESKIANWTWQDLEAMRKAFNAEIRALEKALGL